MFAFFERLVDPYPQAAPQALPTRFFPFLWACAAGARRYLVMVVALTAAIGVFEAWLFRLMAQLVDSLAALKPEQMWQALASNLWQMGLLLFISIFVAMGQGLVKYQAVFANFPMRLRWNYHRLMLEQSLSFYQDEFAGRISTKVMQTALAVRDCWLVVTDILVYVITYFGTMIIVVAAFHISLVWPFLAWLVLYCCALAFFVPRLAKVAQAQADARSLMTGRVTDAYTNIATVKLFSHGQREAVFARAAMREFMVSAQGQMRLVTAFEVVITALTVLLIAGAALTSLLAWQQSLATAGAVAAATAMAMRLNGISHWIMWEMASLFEHVGTVQDGMATLSKSRSVQDRLGAGELKVSQGEVVFEGLTFSYPAALPKPQAELGEAPISAALLGAGVNANTNANAKVGAKETGAKETGATETGATETSAGVRGGLERAAPASKPVIQDFDLRIAPGEKIGLVGRSGAGKSTVVNLLLRLYDLQQGRILIDGQDIASVSQASLRAQVGMVTQDTSLLHRSVRDNITYGRPEADDAAMQRAAQRAQAHEFITSLSDPKGRTGYEAHVGERGVKLSGGQRQRVAIARVMLKDAPILLLDEATSALDSEVEAAIQQSLYSLMEGKTVVAIAHRLSTIAAMDRLVVMDAGRIVETGSHQQLLAQGGIYARLWAHQSGGFLGEEG